MLATARASTRRRAPANRDGMSAPSLAAFRTELRSWLEANVPDDLRPERAETLPEAERVRRLRAWQQRLAEARWVGIGWPVEYGGRGAGIPEQIVYVEEMARARAPEVIGNLGIGIAGPPILAFGSEAQKRHFAPSAPDPPVARDPYAAAVWPPCTSSTQSPISAPGLVHSRDFSRRARTPASGRRPFISQWMTTTTSTSGSNSTALSGQTPSSSSLKRMSGLHEKRRLDSEVFHGRAFSRRSIQRQRAANALSCGRNSSRLPHIDRSGSRTVAVPQPIGSIQV